MPDDQSTFATLLPPAVRRQVEQTDQIAREAGIANAPPAPEPPAGSDPAAAGNTTTVVTPAPTPTPTPAPDGGQTSLPLDDWKQRYDTLQGKYNAEVPELRNQVQGYEGRVRNLEQLLANLSSNPQPAPPTPTPPPVASVVIPADDVETYGQPLIEAAQRWADAKYAPIIQDLERRLLNVEGNTQRVATRSAAQSVEIEMDRTIPNWREVNLDPKFHLWLGQVDLLSGAKRQTLITEAHQSGNAPRTIAFFQAFLREQTVVDPGPGIQQNQTLSPIPEPGAAALPLETLVAPGRGAAPPAAPGAPAKRIWTAAEIAAFYSDKRRGAYRGREAEADSLEQDMVAAGREGRVRQ